MNKSMKNTLSWNLTEKYNSGSQFLIFRIIKIKKIQILQKTSQQFYIIPFFYTKQ